MLKRLLVLPFALAAVLMFGSAVNAAATSSVSNVGDYHYSTVSANQIRVRYQTRNVQRGRRIFRETYRISRYRNGRVVRQLISRTRIR